MNYLGQIELFLDPAIYSRMYFKDMIDCLSIQAVFARFVNGES